MVTRDQERAFTADPFTPLTFAAVIAQLRGASATAEHLLAGVDPTSPAGMKLVESVQAIYAAHQALIDCAQLSRP